MVAEKNAQGMLALHAFASGATCLLFSIAGVTIGNAAIGNAAFTTMT